MQAWIDTHCHLDAAEFDADRAAVRSLARSRGVGLCVIPSVRVEAFDRIRTLAHRCGDAYALGIHPLAVAEARDDALEQLDVALSTWADDPRLVAVGEVGLDYFIPELRTGALRARQEHFFEAQLRIAAEHQLPVLLHVRRSVDQVLRRVATLGAMGGIAHAFNGSSQQAERFLALGFKLGFGGAVTYERATRLQRLVADLPEDAIVMETDAPDIPPQWLYAAAAQRAQGAPQGRNSPAELPRIGARIAELRGLLAEDWAESTRINALAALPRLSRL